MRTVWVIERASSPSLRPQNLGEDEAEMLVWTTDLARALRFTEQHLAERFVRNRVTEAVCIARRCEDQPHGWAADNVALRQRRDALDAIACRASLATTA